MKDPTVPEPLPANAPSGDETLDEPRAGHDFDFTDPNSPLAKYYVQASHVIAVLLVVVVFLVFNLMTPLWHSDVWGHVKIGQWIVENRRLPERELFSPYSDPNLPASNFQWLSQVIMYLDYAAGAWLAGGGPLRQTAGGVDFLRALHALAEAAKTAFLLLAFRQFCRSLPLAIAGVLLVFAFSFAPSAIQRPQAFAEVLFAATLWLTAWPLTHRGAQDGDFDSERMSWRTVAALVAILVTWANVHGSFLIGIALIGLLWLGRSIESVMTRGFRSTLADVPLHRPLVAIALGSILLSLFNPHGWRAIPDILAFAKNPNILSMQEWKPLDFSTGSGGHVGYLALLVLITVTQIFRPRIYRPAAILLLAVFGLGPLLQERLMTWWVMLVPVLLLPMWADGTPPLPAEWTSVLSLRKTIIAAGIVLVGVVWSNFAQLTMGNPPVPLNLSVSQATLWPVTPELLQGTPAAKDADDQKLLDANPLYSAIQGALKNYPGQKLVGGIFTPEAMGDYLVWSLPAKAPVMVYSHVHVFPAAYWEDYMEILFAHPGWRSMLDRHKINLIICQTELRQELLAKLKQDPDWDVVLDQSNAPIHRAYRLFAAVRKKPVN